MTLQNKNLFFGVVCLIIVTMADVNKNGIVALKVVLQGFVESKNYR